jgi:nitroimidazol reductase NimA-like FMN-containing flavoprotein (pyridoxamine 5'-phosphate oxidase superfamily)
MRKSEREVTNREELASILATCDVCRLGLIDDETPYIVPMNFGYDYEQGRLTLYFHGACEGRKIDIIAKNPRACFEMDCSHQLIPNDVPCDFSMHFESIIGNGDIQLCEGEEKIHGLNRIMSHYSDAKEFTYSDKVLAVTAVLKLTATDFTGKRLQK